MQQLLLLRLPGLLDRSPRIQSSSNRLSSSNRVVLMCPGVPES
jgi:hypothetical protein